MMSCWKHTKYKAVNKPKANCRDCWTLWLLTHKKNVVSAEDLLKILETFAPKQCLPIYYDDY